MSEEASESQVILAQWKQACATFDITAKATINALVITLDAIANALAQNEQARYCCGLASRVLSNCVL
jgi:hypothetical protein